MLKITSLRPARFWLLLIPLAVSLIYSAPTSFALEGGGVGIRPANPRADEPLSRAWFIYQSAEPGSVIEDAAVLVNTSGKAVKAKIEALDAVITQDGGFTLTDDETKNQDIGQWITLGQGEISLKPKEEKKVSFRIAVPLDAEVGDHAGGLAVSKIQDRPDITQKVGGGATVGISVRVGARIYLTVAGDIVRSFKILRKSYVYPGGQLYLSFLVRNDGNVRNELEADVSIYGVFGRYDRQVIKIGQVLPKKQVNRQIGWANPSKKAPFFGPYLALMKISDIHKIEGVPAPKPVRTFLFMFFIPWKALLILILLLFGLWLLWQFIAWRKLAALVNAKVVACKVKRGETLPEIAARYGLGWKLVAALNELKPPYALKEGQTVHLPDAKGERREMRLPGYFAQLARPFAIFGASVLGSLFRIDKFRTRYQAPSAKHKATPLLVHKSISPLVYLTAIVEAGDTLRSIAKHFQVDSKTLIKLNHLKFPFRLQPGEELKVPNKAEGLKTSRTKGEKKKRI